MNALATLTTAALSMTSREIADLVGATHDNVLKTVRALVDRGVVSGNETPYIHPQNGQRYTQFELDYRNTMVVVSGYAPELRARVIDRWLELEAGAAPRVPQTMAQALRLAADQAERIEALALTVEQQRPAVEFVERYVDATGLKGFREVAKLLRANEREFRAFLLERRVMYRLGKRLTAHQAHVDAGRFWVKTGVADANGYAFIETKFTPKGVEWIAGEWARAKIKALVA